ncbi:MAG: ABC transporter ATP-binding protein [Limnochordales bacterium]|nr:ABC transporter ATP-binding protein [Limnochordales bacterium]
MLEIRDLHVAYGDARVLHGVSLTVRQGELVTVIGANGAGKTTLMKAVLGLVPRVEGDIRFDGRSLLDLPPWERAALGIGYVPEGRRVFPDLTVEQNLRMGAYTVRDGKRVQAGLEEVYALFPRLAERRRQRAGSMSGGEQQMLAIARALISRPRLLLIDEVSMGLMPIMVERAFDIIRTLHQQGMTILLVEQNARQALAAADRGYVLELGRVVLEGTVEQLQRDPRVQAAYLGLGTEGHHGGGAAS